jgi:hypothetical protein
MFCAVDSTRIPFAWAAAKVGAADAVVTTRALGRTYCTTRDRFDGAAIIFAIEYASTWLVWLGCAGIGRVKLPEK